SAFLTLAVVIETLTGAWSSRPVAAGWSGLTVTSTVGEVFESELPDDDDDATRPTDETTPGGGRLLGSVIVTRSPAFTCVCRAASSAIVTMRRVDVAGRIGEPGPAGLPSVAETVLIRTGPGRKTACPSVRVPVSATLRSACSLLSARLVDELNSS